MIYCIVVLTLGMCFALCISKELALMVAGSYRFLVLHFLYHFCGGDEHMRALRLNLLAMTLGIAIAALYLFQHALVHAQSKNPNSNSRHTENKVVTEKNNDYTFASQKDFKNHEILKHKKPQMQSFDAKAISVVDDQLHAKVARYRIEEKKKQDAADRAYYHSEREVYVSYLEYVKKQKALQKKVEKDLKDELDALSLTEEDFKSRSLDE